MVKDKGVCERTYDDGGFKRRAACVCVRSSVGVGTAGSAPTPASSSSVAGSSSSSSPAVVVDMGPREVLLVTGSQYPDRWIVPGGGVEPCEEPDAAAIREVREEAGVVGTLGRCLGTFENGEKRTRTVVYVMVVRELLEDWEDKAAIGRRRKWFPIDQAKELLAEHKAIQKTYLDAYTDGTAS